MKNLTFPVLTLLALLGAGALRAESSSAIYLLGGIDGKMLTNQDANNYFNLDGELGPRGLPSPVVHLGFQFMRFLSLEASVSMGPTRDNTATYENGILGTTRKVTTRWGLTTFSFTPGVTFAGAGFLNMLGLRVGQANLNGRVDDEAYGLSGSYDQSAQAFDLGVIFRSSRIMMGHFSAGIEVGYDWTVFKEIKNSNGSGTYATPHSPERNVSTIGHNGDQTELDFSGAHVAFVIGLWSNAVVKDDAPAKAD